jgi:hypothetical protein
MTITGFEQDIVTRRIVGQSWYIEYGPEVDEKQYEPVQSKKE